MGERKHPIGIFVKEDIERYREPIIALKRFDLFLK